MGGIISYAVFSHFGDDGTDSHTKWRPWQVLFVLEGSLTIVVAMAGYFWLPHSVETAWFLTIEERKYASSRIVRDRDMQNESAATQVTDQDEGIDYDEESRGLLSPSKPPTTTHKQHLVDDRGLTPHDVVSAICNTKIWHILACNILASIPVYAFSVFLPLVLAPLTKANPALVNLLTAPPHICGAIVLFTVARYSDKHQIRLVPVLFGLATMVTGLIFAVGLPMSWAIPRYLALNVLLSGTYVASPLTVAWISGNTPSPGKRALLLGINGWGNLAGIFSALLFRPKYAATGYIVPFWWTLASVAVAALGYVFLLRRLKVENETRQRLLSDWIEEDIENERAHGNGPHPPTRPWLQGLIDMLRSTASLAWLAEWLDQAKEAGRKGDEKITFIYGL